MRYIKIVCVWFDLKFGETPLSEFAPILPGLVLLFLAGIHVYWGLGGLWPGTSPFDLAQKVVGGVSGSPMPGRVACFSVAIFLFLSSLLVTSSIHGFRFGLSTKTLSFLQQLLAGIILLRGVGGFFDRYLRPHTRSGPFERLNILIYSPLCLCLGFMILVFTP